MLLSFFRFMRGYVGFTASGRFPERFLNAAAVDGINLWSTSPYDGGIRGETSVGDYKRIRNTARKAGVRLKITKKRGFPFIAKRHSDRIGLPIGALLGAALLILLSQFIWSVEIVGAESVSEYRITQSLKGHGVYVGGFKGSVDVLSSQRGVLFDISELSWVSINTLGCKSTVDVREKAEKSDPPQDPSPCNIKAKCDGVITKINAQNGVSEVGVGSGVAKGDLLVSGVLPTQQNTIRFVRAEAQVYADVNSNIEIKIPKTYDYNSVTENKINRNELSFFGLRIPASLSFDAFPLSVCTENTRDLTLNGNALPIGITTQTTHELTEMPITPDKAQAQAAFEKSLLLSECFEHGDCVVKSREITVTEQDGGYICSCNYIFNQNIAQSVDFSVTDGG